MILVIALVVVLICCVQTPHVGIPILLFILAGPVGRKLGWRKSRRGKRATSPAPPAAGVQ